MTDLAQLPLDLAREIADDTRAEANGIATSAWRRAQSLMDFEKQASRSHFAAMYRLHCLPKIRQEIERQAALIDLDIVDYDDGYDAVCELADRLGRWRLLPKPFAELGEWILAHLSAAVPEACERRAELERHGDARRIADPVTHYESLAADSRNPDQMRWTFAAISPEYRAHLQAVRRERP